jgi:hypothetical protein
MLSCLFVILSEAKDLRSKHKILQRFALQNDKELRITDKRSG